MGHVGSPGCAWLCRNQGTDLPVLFYGGGECPENVEKHEEEGCQGPEKSAKTIEEEIELEP